MPDHAMERIKVRIALPQEQQMLREIVQGAVSLDGGMDILPPDAPASSEDILIVEAPRVERDTLDAGGEVLALDRRRDHIDLYVLQLLGRVRGSGQLANAIRRLMKPLTGRSS
jgi:hypothetical protein